MGGLAVVRLVGKNNIGLSGDVAKKVAVLYIHGVNNDRPGFSKNFHDHMVEEVEFQVPAHLSDLSGDFVCREACWFDVFQAQQVNLTTSLKQTGLSWKSAREFVASSVAQAVGYEDTVGIGAYEEVHTRLATALKELGDIVGPNAPLVIVAHSLGSVIASNFIWDRQHGSTGDTPFERLETLRLYVTMGSPMALYAGRWPSMGTPISMRSRNATWINIMAPADLLAWPLSGLNSAYSKEVSEDIVVKVGGFLGRTPAAHTRYWESGRVSDKVAEYVKPVWDEMKKGRR